MRMCANTFPLSFQIKLNTKHNNELGNYRRAAVLPSLVSNMPQNGTGSVTRNQFSLGFPSLQMGTVKKIACLWEASSVLSFIVQKGQPLLVSNMAPMNLIKWPKIEFLHFSISHLGHKFFRQLQVIYKLAFRIDASIWPFICVAGMGKKERIIQSHQWLV